MVNFWSDMRDVIYERPLIIFVYIWTADYNDQRADEGQEERADGTGYLQRSDQRKRIGSHSGKYSNYPKTGLVQYSKGQK